MPVIALTQGMGSLAQDIAEQLAAGAEPVDAAARGGRARGRQDARLEEPDQPAARRQGRRRSSGCAPTARRWRCTPPKRCSRPRHTGNVVIRGWGATCLLRPVPHVPCIRIMRPFEQARAVADEGARHRRRGPGRGRDPAQRPCQRQRACTTSSACSWGDPVLFDLVLNTDRLSVDTCVQQIKALLARPEFAETDAVARAAAGHGAGGARCAPRCVPTRRPTASTSPSTAWTARSRCAASWSTTDEKAAAVQVSAGRARRDGSGQPAARDVDARPSSRRTGSEPVRAARPRASDLAALLQPATASRPTG